jgi:hypothetical protein
MKLGTLILGGSLALTSLPALAVPVSLAGDDLCQAVSGKTVILNVSAFALPIYSAPNRRIKGARAPWPPASR